jgi:MoaA/NifB/PqqE/SkfB family radical SAM enzyme
MCPSRLYASSSRKDMDFKVFLNIAEYFNRTELIHLQGWGEPLAHPEILEMIQIAKEHAVTGLTTNGTLLEKLSSALVELQLDYIAISVSGPETHREIRYGSNFRDIVKNIEVLNGVKREKGSDMPRVNLTFLMTKTNIHELLDVVELAGKLDAGLIATHLDYVFDEITDSLKIFDNPKEKIRFERVMNEAERKAEKYGVEFTHPPFDLMERAICDAHPDSAIVFSVEGEVFPCVYLNFPFDKIPRIFKGNKVLIGKPEFGNIVEKSLEDIWNSKYYKTFRERFEKRIEVTRSLRYILGFKPDFSKLKYPEVCRGCYKLYGI